jgi:hypothetical protein
MNVSCRRFIEEGIPDLKCSDSYRTRGASLSSSFSFPGNALDWDDIDQIVEDYINAPGQNRQPPDATLFRRPTPAQRNPMESEVYLCGEEKGFEGRFNHNVLHPVQHAADLHHLGARFGDFKATKEGSKSDERLYPDMSCMTRSGQELRCVGEIKADWSGQIDRDYHRGDDNNRPNFKKWISKCFRKPLGGKLCSLILSRADINLHEDV